MSKRPLLSCCVVALSLAIPEAAWAQGANCPPGSWFCAETSPVPAAPPPVQVQVQPGYAPAPPPPVVVYQPPPPVVVYQQAPQRYYAVPPPPPTQVYYYRPRRQRSEWGLNLHFEGAAFGNKPGVTSDGIWGGGLGLRYRPVPVFALESDLDFVGGVDYNGLRRSETATSINGLFFLNPQSRAQVYLLAGFGWSWAHLPDTGQDYDYFGGQGGLGVEFRAGKHVALNFDARGFIRTRIDDGAQYPQFAEFKDGNGQTTNTSAGVLFTGGMTFYF